MSVHRQHRILNVEDDAAHALMERKVLEAAGYEVVDAADGATALGLLEDEEFDAVLLDYRLPDMTGRQVIGRLGRRIQQIPVIVVTAYGDERLALNLLQIGAEDYVSKDTSLDFVRTLPAKIRSSLKRSGRNGSAPPGPAAAR